MDAMRRREEGGGGGRRKRKRRPEGHEIGRADVGKVQGDVVEATAGRKGNGRNEQERRKVEAWKERKRGKEGRVGVEGSVEGRKGGRKELAEIGEKTSAKIRHHAHFRASCNPSRRSPPPSLRASAKITTHQQISSTSLTTGRSINIGSRCLCSRHTAYSRPHKSYCPRDMQSRYDCCTSYECSWMQSWAKSVKRMHCRPLHWTR